MDARPQRERDGVGSRPDTKGTSIADFRVAVQAWSNVTLQPLQGWVGVEAADEWLQRNGARIIEAYDRGVPRATPSRYPEPA